MLKKRTTTALLGFPFLALSIWFSQPIPWFTIFIAICAIVALRELYLLATLTGANPSRLLGILWAILIIFSPHFANSNITLGIITGGLVLTLLENLLPGRRDFQNWLWTAGGALYIGLLLSFLVSIQLLPEGRNWLFFTLFVTFGSDIAAYLIGVTLGRHYLAPALSPHKTWEGTIGGLAGATVIGLLFLLPTPLQVTISPWQVILLSLLISVFGLGGDMVESLIKRKVGVKDSSNRLPGHGGFLDRIDSVTMTGVITYYFVLLLIL